MASLHLDLDNTLGAAFIGNIVAGVLYGVTCLQTFNYYKKGQGDCLAFRLVIYGLWILDTLQIALVTHTLYFYLIKNYNNPLVLLFPTWSIISQVFITCVGDLTVRIIYGRRVWKISHNIYIIAFVGVASAGAFGGGFAFAIEAFIEQTFANFSHISYLMYLALGSAVAADILIAVSLCLSLSRSRTGFKKTDSIVTILMLYAINSSVLTTYASWFQNRMTGSSNPKIFTDRVCSAACLITYTIWPEQFTFIGIYVCLSKLFLNSLLAMLNGRKSLKRRIHGLSDSPFPFSNGSAARPAEFVTSFTSKDAYAMNSPTSPVVISVSTEVETKHGAV
ncbi:hypothetical protein BDN70DRAFT_996414 [Pholiota conissans]|uniref:DUF6534 domain-containing protein n=1 Tax=Pholiota conissans TaxID=109636 RepID=A0A9P5YTB4_9AGAR|nr:hypothetical protein BDN70DRAFT_996414 [Pholiota conissans]